ncbi:hypothetical protein ABT095_25905 [Kitasatospora sp. NPDC002227]|uniref:hypothetical protein n=1 Tax=Kitasatospora sp. NPDC002227 TaxID=3154773 RepID=UPI0033180321
MSTNRSRRIDQATAEQLLGGGTVGTSGGPAALADNAALAGLLAAAAAPAAGAAELPGEAKAMAAFREARRTPAPEPRRRTMASTAPARALSAKSAKALLAALALTALGGVAVAATTGIPGLPVVLGGARGGSGGSPASAVSVPAGTSAAASERPSVRPSTAPDRTQALGSAKTAPAPTHGSESSAHPDGSATPGRPDQGNSPAVAGLGDLCRSFEDAEANGGKAKQLLTTPPYAPLVGAAKGAEHVEAFCTSLLGKGKDHGGPATTPPRSGPTKGPADSAPSKAAHVDGQAQAQALALTGQVQALTSGLPAGLGAVAPAAGPLPDLTSLTSLTGALTALPGQVAAALPPPRPGLLPSPAAPSGVPVG